MTAQPNTSENPNPSNDLPGSVGLLILRVGLGAYMASHGVSKVQKILAGDLEKFADPIGLGTGLSLVLVAFAEFGCALLVMVGLFTRIAVVPIVLTMAVAAFVVHGSDPWTMAAGSKAYLAGAAESWGSKEPALLFLIPYLALAFTGPGRLSLDQWLASRRG